MLLLLPTIALLLMFIAYPFMRGILLAVTNSKVGVLGEFVGFENFARLLKDPIFHAISSTTRSSTRLSLRCSNSSWVSGSPCCSIVIFKIQGFRAPSFLLPFIVPTVLACFAWKWMFDPTFSVLNWMLFKLGIVAAGAGINWLGDGDMAMLSIMIVNIWRGVPFFAISLMAGLQTISPDLGEAAAIDGAKPWQRFWYITWPLLMPVTMVVVLFSVIQTFSDFQIVYVMTGGSPGQCDPPVRDLCLPARHQHRPAQSGCRRLARHVPAAVWHCDLPADVHPQGGDTVMSNGFTSSPSLSPHP